MRKSRFTELQILAILGEGEAGLPVAEVCGLLTRVRVCSMFSRSQVKRELVAFPVAAVFRS